MVVAGGDVLACADDQEALEPVAPEPVQLVFEAFPVGAQTAVGQVVDGFAFDGELVLEAADRVIARVKGPGDSREAGEFKRVLFPGIDRDYGALAVFGA